ncbi:MAG: hypothetical protein D6722_16160 [Bacteroidetes bacterium]|nr:MAG: hypothetical protein D6722_16160 [Bacteroidota bacterium]
MLMKRILLLSTLIVSLLGLTLSGCGSDDLSLINEVKRFDPEWMTLSSKVSFIDRYLRITARRYQADFDEVDPYISDPATTERSNLYGLRSQYRNMMQDRDKLETRFGKTKEAFVSAVESFNDWQTQLMKGRLDEDEARQEFVGIKAGYDSLAVDLNQLQDDLIRNIEQHNALMNRITRAVDIHASFEIRYDR